MPKRQYKQAPKSSRQDYWPEEQHALEGSPEKTSSARRAGSSAGETLDAIDQVLAQNETALNPDKPDESQALSPQQLEKAESGGLYSPAGDDSHDKSLRKRLANISLRKKAAAGLGMGTTVTVIIALITLAPIYRIPGIMDRITEFVGAEVKEIAEERAGRYVIQYLIQRAGGNPSNYVIKGSPLETLWATFRTNRLEDKIYKQTGLRVVNENGRVVLKLDRDTLGPVRNYDDVKKLLDSPDLTNLKKRELRKAMRTLVRTTVPAWRIKKISKFADDLRRKYGARFVPFTEDKTKNKQENIEDMRKQQINTVAKQNVSLITSVLNCILKGDCDRFKRAGDPVDTTRRDEGERIQETADKLNRAAQESYTETVDEVSRTGEEFTKTFTQKVVSKMIGSAASAATTAGVITTADLAIVAVYHSITINETRALYMLPTTMAEQSTGAMYAQWAGFGDTIKAGLNDLIFVSALNEQVQGAEKAQTYKFMATGDASEGVEVKTRIESDARYPSQIFMHYFSYSPNYHTTKAITSAWYHTVHKLIDKFGELAFSLVSGLLGPTINKAMEAIFGEDWREKLAAWGIEMLLKFMGVAVDPLAKGADLMNTVFVGGQVAMNSYCQTNLGCKALTPLIDKGPFDTPRLDHSAVTTPTTSSTTDKKLDMAVLPLSERLFSLDEPNSLLSEGIRAMPANSPISWMSGAFNQVASIPSTLLSVFSGRSLAASPTPEAAAAIAGVRQYGADPEDLAQDIAPEVRLNAEGAECPEVDQDTTFNLCQADKEVVSMLMCLYTNCPELEVGAADPDNTHGLIANLRKVWDNGYDAAARIW